MLFSLRRRMQNSASPYPLSGFEGSLHDPGKRGETEKKGRDGRGARNNTPK